MPPKYTHKKRHRPRPRSVSPVPPPGQPTALPTTRSRSITPPPGPLNRGPPIPPPTIRQPRHASQAPADTTPRREATKRKGISPLDSSGLLDSSSDDSSTADIDRRTAARADPQATWDLIGAEDDEPSKPDDNDEEFVYEDDLDLLSEADMLDKALEELNVDSVMDEEVYRRIAIAYVYFNVLGAPSREMWGKHGGTMGRIKEILKIPSSTKIDYVLEDLVECKAKKSRYTGKRQVHYAKS